MLGEFYLILQKVKSNYHLIFALIALVYALMTFFNPSPSFDYKIVLFFYVLAFSTAGLDLRQDVKWLPFLLLSIPLLFSVHYLNIHGYELWGKMLNWQISKDVVIDLNDTFRNIPYNDAAFMRVFQTDTLTQFMRFVYQNGFVLPATIPLYRAFVSKDLRKMLRYLLSAHLFQVFLITPFYLTFHLQEVWYVLGHPDGMARGLTPEQAAGVTINCFPSMHTSIAFAMFLVLLHEKNRLFKAVWGFYCLSVIVSTMYLEIHWVIDVLAGMLFAYGTVKLVDKSLSTFERFLPSSFKPFYFKTPYTLPLDTSQKRASNF